MLWTIVIQYDPEAIDKEGELLLLCSWPATHYILYAVLEERTNKNVLFEKIKSW